MPRVTDKQYIDRHYELSDLWLYDRGRFRNLSVDQQLDLHTYYATIKVWTDQQLREHRAKVTKQRPSLANKAGKAYQALIAGAVQPQAVIYGSAITTGKLQGTSHQYPVGSPARAGSQAVGSGSGDARGGVAEAEGTRAQEAA